MGLKVISLGKRWLWRKKEVGKLVIRMLDRGRDCRVSTKTCSLSSLSSWAYFPESLTFRYISQNPLHLGVATGLSSWQWHVSGNDVCHFLTKEVQKKVVSLLICRDSHKIEGCCSLNNFTEGYLIAIPTSKIQTLIALGLWEFRVFFLLAGLTFSRLTWTANRSYFNKHNASSHLICI